MPRAASGQSARHCRCPLRTQKSGDLADRGEVEALRIGTRGLLLGELPTEAGEHFGFELVEVVAADSLWRGYRDRTAATHFEHTAAYGDMMLLAAIVAPTRHRYRERRQEIGMTWQNAERAGLVFGPQMRDIVGLYDNRQRRGDGEPHGTLARA
jgi:hypothetical protein